MLADEDIRKHLEALDPETSSKDGVWRNARPLTHEFNEALLDLFFDEKSKLHALTRMYGVF
jgi:hypothetical protein